MHIFFIFLFIIISFFKKNLFLKEKMFFLKTKKYFIYLFSY
ncbi:hypothetical protein AXA84_0062 [Candidatus Phytoplasma oryzae]|uniref:Uncharacterized protein n=1 Tax=Candidatus Phytoplasma oryzae TaxID=203274 RepID=A0A139JR03_9MOLU|nr:hypothetical protein AXA84_0062 [Candidatus Phytoplasma oryzae]